MNVDLPPPRCVVVGASKFMGHYGILLTIGIGILAFGFKAYYATPGGPLYRRQEPAQGPDLRPIAAQDRRGWLHPNHGDADRQRRSDCLEITASTAGNAIVEEAILSVKKAIEEGRTIVDPLKAWGASRRWSSR